MTDITKAKALELLTEAVKEKGAEFVYTEEQKGDKGWGGTCVYTRDGEPSCIVGHALARAGVPIEVLSAIDYGPASLDETGINDPEVIRYLESHDVTLDAGAIDLFAAVQRKQDNGVAWGEAVTNSIGTLTNGRI